MWFHNNNHCCTFLSSLTSPLSLLVWLLPLVPLAVLPLCLCRSRFWLFILPRIQCAGSQRSDHIYSQTPLQLFWEETICTFVIGFFCRKVEFFEAPGSGCSHYPAASGWLWHTAVWWQMNWWGGKGWGRGMGVTPLLRPVANHSQDEQSLFELCVSFCNKICP